MNPLPLHPQVVHLPIALALLLPLLASGVLLAWWKGWLPHRSWALVVALQAVLAGSPLIASNTGEADEERVEAIVRDAAIDAHEDAAGVFAWAAAAALVLAVAALVWPNARVQRVLAGATVAGTLLVLLLGYQVGHSGGRLVYEHGAAQAYAGPAAAGASGGPAGALPADARRGDRRDQRGSDDD